MSCLGGTQYVITAGAHSATVVEVGAGLQRYSVDGVDITCSYADSELPPKGCGTTLVPWPNRIAAGSYTFDGVQQQLGLSEPDIGNAIHGLGRWTRWTLGAQQDDSVTLALDVVPQKGYPFQVHVEKTYSLGADGLTVAMSARNDGTARAPFGAGSHPYLDSRGHRLDDVTLLLPAAQILDVDDASIPTGTREVSQMEDFREARPLGMQRFDTGFTGLGTTGGRGAVEVRTPSGGARLWFDEAYRYLQVFTVDGLTDGHSGVACEPMTCAANAFNSGDGLIVLDPGGTWSGSWGIQPL